MLRGPKHEQQGLYEFTRHKLGASNIEQDELAIAKDFGFIVIFAMSAPRIKYDAFPHGGEHEFEEDTIKHLNGVIEKVSGKYVRPCQHWLALRPRILELLDSTVKSLGGDAGQVCFCGMSIGGKGVLELAAALPVRFSAVVAACGYFGERERGRCDSSNAA